MDSKTRRVVDLFTQISAVPRPSQKEERIRNWLEMWAVSSGFTCRQDRAGNLIVDVPASVGKSGAPGIVLQGHMDMVCEKQPDSSHDFNRDPIVPVIEGEWLKAEGTSLGADNGIALALALALAEDPDVLHGPLELLFTVDEETGLTGAKNLDPGLMRGSILLNLDSEDEGVFIVGCAGGRELVLNMGFETQPAASPLWSLTVAGLRGGHSGVDIHLQRANAAILLARLLNDLQGAAAFGLASVACGTAHNAIPRDAGAVVGFDGDSAAVQRLAAELQTKARAEFSPADASIVINAEPYAFPCGVLNAADSARVNAVLLALPHGPARMSAAFENLVETSHNLAMVNLKDGRLEVCTSQRSLIASGLAEATAKVAAVGSLAGAAMACKNEYPPWTPDLDSALLQRCRRLYQDLFGRAPAVKSIHAGLECAIIKAKRPEMEMISLGPTLRNPHSPDERVLLPSIRPVWDLTAALLASYCGTV